MKLTILGSGTVVPDGARNSAGYFVELADAQVMMDCGAGTVHALARYNLAWQRMTHLFISHFHVDHAGELASLFFAFKHAMREARSEPLALIGPRGLDRVMNGLRLAFGENLFEPKFPVELKVLAPGERVEIGKNATLSVHKTPHTDESLAVRIESDNRTLGYTGDTDYSDELARFFRAADILISECSFRERREGVPHVSIDDVRRMAARAEVARLIVTHFYFDVDETELKRQLQDGFSGEVIIGRDGMIVDV
ncbi:MAG TPA: ribonuclease Z [Blastocatellia bacterium]|nr:ribonuclease Z [Blastocatellia bacterium]